MGNDPLIQKLVDSYSNWPISTTQQKNCAGGTGILTKDLFPFDALFSPIQINRITVKNRIVMAPMCNFDMCEETGRPNDKMLHYFFARAHGGAGLLTTGSVPVSHGIDPTVSEAGSLSCFPRIDLSRSVYSGWRDLAQGVHAFGAKIFIQLTAGLGRVGSPSCLGTHKKFPVSASFLPNYFIPAIPCIPLSDRKLGKIILNIGHAAADACAMGLDGVYLHGHEGYLLGQLTNPAFNHRKFGRYADWKRFGLDTVRGIRARVGPHYPIMYRIDLSLALEECYDEQTINSTHLRKFRDSRTLPQTLEYMESLVKAGVDIFDADLGCYDNWWLPHPPYGMPAGCFLEIARTVKNHFAERGILSNAGIPVPIVGVGKLGYPDIAESALQKGDCDMIMLGRPLLADPEWPNKVYRGDVESICPCIGCQEGCLDEVFKAGHIQCAVNPLTGFEHKMPTSPVEAKLKKRIAVIGAGPGGVVVAITAAKRGHKVDLYEKTDRIGGRIVAGSQAIVKFDMDNYLRYLERQVREAQINWGMRFLSQTEADPLSLKEEGYDVIVFAIGYKNSTPSIVGLEIAPNVIQATTLLRQPELIDNPPAGTGTPTGTGTALVIGGGVVGCETAQWLAYEHGRKVTVVERQPYFMSRTCTANRTHLLHTLKAKDVTLLNMTTVTGIDGPTVTLIRNHHKNVPNPLDTWTPILPDNASNPRAPEIGNLWKEETLTTDLIILAVGGQSDDSLFYTAQKERSATELYNIGDSFAPGKILDAVRAAYHLGVSL
ncbi:MAG: FAD-dependent oxidoreductase [Peptococcaceae bacterium]|nr:FAD-dependent oxidoreductase [Peptococcaceae bacterium]